MKEEEKIKQIKEGLLKEEEKKKKEGKNILKIHQFVYKITDENDSDFLEIVQPAKNRRRAKKKAKILGKHELQF